MRGMRTIYLFFRGAVVRGPASVVHLFCRA
nr:MAG TPA: hypothetical protein [Caudoviricetes sp.]